MSQGAQSQSTPGQSTPGQSTPSQAALSTLARDAVAAHAAGAYPYEACGLLIGRVDEDGPRVTRALRCPNVAPAEERHHRFAIDPRVVLNVRRSLRGSGERILGFYHSHPDAAAVPSSVDREYLQLWPDTLWLISPVPAGEPRTARAWWLDADAAEPRELPVRILAVREPRLLACPE